MANVAFTKIINQISPEEDVSQLRSKRAIGISSHGELPSKKEQEELFLKAEGLDLDKIKWLFLESKVSMAYLASKVGVSRTYINYIRDGYTGKFNENTVKATRINYELACKLTQFAYRLEVGDEIRRKPIKREKAKRPETHKLYVRDRTHTINFVNNFIEDEDKEQFLELINDRLDKIKTKKK
ncbi:TPA: hypothetical protein ACGWER_001724 [Streptococcus agalactiae]|nr:hypothetical protein [Streptococcus agalactiae]HEO2267373.1 hypothetical protein [Streptococcus agalactiae]HEO7770453.1 hypothetical protein [Streptococcus agalactiae]